MYVPMTSFIQISMGNIHETSVEGMSLSGRSEVTLRLKVSHFATVPTLVYRGKVTSEDLVDGFGTTLNHRRNDPKLTFLCHS